MSRFSCLNILKSQAKYISKARGIPHSHALEAVAKQAGFESFHELRKVFSRDPTESRLLSAALGSADLSDVIYESRVFYGLDNKLSEQLSGEMASTNATDFTIEDLSIESVNYDDSNGLLTINCSLSYQGEQVDDKPYSGTSFYLELLVRLARRDGEWLFDEDESVTVKSLVTDQDLDWQSQHMD